MSVMLQSAAVPALSVPDPCLAPGAAVLSEGLAGELGRMQAELRGLKGDVQDIKGMLSAFMAQCRK